MDPHDGGMKYMECLPPCILCMPNEAYDALPRDYCKDAFMIFEKMLERKIASEGEDFIRVDSRPGDLLVQMDMEELKQKYPIVLEYDYIYFIQLRIILLQRCKAIETCYKLMEFFAENYYPGIIIEWVERDKAELDKIIRGTVTTDALIVNRYSSFSILFSMFKYLTCLFF
ncbi:hypothetical protein QJS10_CPB04g00074 [Acorus calamus]|uniref:Uncharacterized protein n=1 Tax=Acorus calamus TaxID=4465 RepID=A0AAV9EY55_ACOCL|nr:hypothetical protein QJS10_CPB04g00074 [Acorus calamus]